jgi:hypothetical protein
MCLISNCIEHQSARHRDPLLLAAGELTRAALAELAQLDHPQGAVCAFFDLALRQLPHLEREGQILGHRHVREESVVLEHHADTALVGRHVVDRRLVEIDLAMGRRLEAGQHHEARGLARPGRPQHGEKLAAFDVEVEVFDD